MVTPRSASGSVPADYFEAKFSEDIDPWQFRTSAYEQDKFQATIDALSRPRYERALEIGCAIGVLSARLAAHCELLIAIDASSVAIAEASRQDLPNVRFHTAVLPEAFPAGS